MTTSTAEHKKKEQLVFDRSPEALANHFHRFARFETPQLDSPMYTELAYGVSLDPFLLELSSHTQPGQPAPNTLFAAVQYLLLRGADHPLRTHYPIVTGEPRPSKPALPLFRAFCEQYRDDIQSLLRTRRTQTNAVRRASVLVPAFAFIHQREARPLALIEVGTSAGLNLHWDHFHHTYFRDDKAIDSWGPANSELALRCDLRADLPALPAQIPVASRVGIDTHPIDIREADSLLWLRALIWPEHRERHRWLETAAKIHQRQNPLMLAGDANDLIEGQIAACPPEATAVVYATHVLYQFGREALSDFLQALDRAGSERPVWMIALEGTGERCSELIATRFEGGTREALKLADANPHGWWIRWQPDPQEARQRPAVRYWQEHATQASA